jgi:[protein-PII] uridylyltransferase
MEKSVHISAPYFDPQKLRDELSTIFREQGDAVRARVLVLPRLKSLVADARTAARAGLEADGNGRRCAAGLSQFQDELIRLLYDYTVWHVYRATNPSDAECMSIVATGGYGRALLAPESDVDLLFLLPYKQTPWGESVAEYILYMLWDLGFKVGHATRTVGQCVKLGAADITICSALLDARFIYGDAELFANFEQRFRNEVVSGNARHFIDAKMAERDERHRVTGESRYKVEPNIKDGKGGLRDLHTLHWLSMYLYGQGVGAATVAAGIFKSDELTTFRRCEDFLWTIRCYLHFLSGRAEETLTFDVQPWLARQLEYNDRKGLRAVERFMKHYFLVAKDVGDLTTILCGALELQQLKSAPGFSKLLGPLNWKVRRQLRTRTDFRIDNDRLNVADQDVFKRDPVNLIRFFAVARYTNAFLHPDAIRLLRQSLRLIDDKLRADPTANRIFLELLTADSGVEVTLRRMNDAGVLGRFVPEFGRVVGMTQFNMYHHYTVDEHLVRTMGMLADIERGGSTSELPLSTEIIKNIKNRRALFVAAFLHDIGKGQEEDHSIIGARVARKLGPRFGLTAAESETAAWLIQEHLLMSNIAQSRDLSDPKTIRDFADVVQSPERLKLLLLLTVADIRAVGPGVWNGWKGQLLRTLFYEAEPAVAGGHTQVKRSQRINEVQTELRAALEDWRPADIDALIERHYPDYWLRTDTDRQVEHAKLLQRADREGTHLAAETTTDAFTAITDLTVVAANHPRLLALLAGACAAAGANIAGAHIMTTRDGFALDTFLLNREFDEDEDEYRRGRRILDMIGQLLRGDVWLKDLLAQQGPPPRRALAFAVEPEVIVNNSLSDSYTVIEVAGRDRPGLLYDLTSNLSDLLLDITSAHITTFGEKAVDVFYVTDLTGKKITQDARQQAIREQLEEVLSGIERDVEAQGVVQA